MIYVQIMTAECVDITMLDQAELAKLESDFDANPELAALVVDLIEEVRLLKHRLVRG